MLFEKIMNLTKLTYFIYFSILSKIKWINGCCIHHQRWHWYYFFLALHFPIASTHIQIKNLLKIYLKKYLNSFICCKIVKFVKNTCKEAIFLVKLLAYSREYTNKQ